MTKVTGETYSLGTHYLHQICLKANQKNGYLVWTSLTGAWEESFHLQRKRKLLSQESEKWKERVGEFIKVADKGSESPKLSLRRVHHNKESQVKLLGESC